MTVPVSLSSGPGAETPMPAMCGRCTGRADLADQPPDLVDDAPRSAGDIGRQGVAAERPRRRDRPARHAIACRRGRCRWRSALSQASASAAHGAHPRHALRKILRAEGQRSHHDRFSAGLAQPGHGVLADAAVGRKHDATHAALAARSARAPRASAASASAIEVLAFDADAGAEQRQHADTVEKGRRRGDRRVQLKHDAGLEPFAAIFSSAASALAFSAWTLIRSAPASANCSTWLCRIEVGHHQMDMQRLCRGAARDGDEVGEEQQRRREMAVGDVDVEDVGERLDTPRCRRRGGRDPPTTATFRRAAGSWAAVRASRRADDRLHGQDEDPFALATADEEGRQRGAELGDVARRVGRLGRDLDKLRAWNRRGQRLRVGQADGRGRCWSRAPAWEPRSTALPPR